MIVRKHKSKAKYKVVRVDASSVFYLDDGSTIETPFESFLHVDDGDWPYPGDSVWKYPSGANNKYTVLEVIPNWMFSGTTTKIIGRPTLIVVPNGLELITDDIREQLDWGEWIICDEPKGIYVEGKVSKGVYTKPVTVETTEVKVGLTKEMIEDFLKLKGIDYVADLEKKMVDEFTKDIDKSILTRLMDERKLFKRKKKY